MKILEVIYRFPPSVGGSQKVVYELSKEFVKKGHDVTVLTSTSMDNNDVRGLSTSRGFSLKSSTYKKTKENMSGIKVYRFDPLFQFWTFAINPNLKRYLKKNISKYDLVHVHGYQSYEAYIVSRLSKKYNVNYVLTAHDIISHHPGFFVFIKKIYDILFGRRILKRAKYLIALTKENYKQYLDIYNNKNKVKIIPNGINTYNKTKKDPKIMKKLGKPDKIILFLGRIVEYKGCQYILDALPEILKKHPNSKAVFAGIDGGYTSTLKQKAKKLGIIDNCYFTGAIDDIEPYLNLADVFVFPSRGEGFGLAPVEAMSVGVPAVLANMGGLKYVLKDIGGIPINMKKDISFQISNSVIDVFSGKISKSDIKKSEKNAKNYRWDKISTKTLDLFEKSLNKN